MFTVYITDNEFDKPLVHEVVRAEWQAKQSLQHLTEVVGESGFYTENEVQPKMRRRRIRRQR